MKSTVFNVSLASLAFGASVFSASNALAATTCTTPEGSVTISDPSSCQFVVSGGCTAQCTAPAVQTTCDTMCTASASETCTTTCSSKCDTQCKTTPTTFSCQDYCETDCNSGCMASCTGSDCSATCSANCSSECMQQCTVHPGTTDCTTVCGECCGGSCTVQANITCDVDCTSKLVGGCTAKCSEPQGALFCDGQYIDISEVTDCNFSLSATVSTTSSGNVKCSAAPAGTSPFSIPAGLAAIAGVGIALARRRRPGN